MVASILFSPAFTGLAIQRSPFVVPVRRFEQRPASLLCSLSSPCTRCASSLSPEPRGPEHFVALYLNGQHQVAAYSIVSIGTANQAPVSPREVFQRAVLTGAISIVVAHNHPSKSTVPSHEDRAVTTRLREAGELLGIKVLDHVIVTNSAFLSMKDDDGW